VEKIVDAAEDIRFPVCVAGERACPPEDVGGVWGYAELLKAIRNPKHAEHAHYLEWIGALSIPNHSTSIPSTLREPRSGREPEEHACRPYGKLPPAAGPKAFPR